MSAPTHESNVLFPNDPQPVDEPAAGPATSLERSPAPPPLPVTPRPVAEHDRFQSLDVVRGIALIGILLVNIEHFAMVRGARYDPRISGGDEAVHHAIWLAKMLFADTKFLAIFTLLFGAGLALMDDRRRRLGEAKAFVIYYRRIGFLLILGIAHGLFLWRGDILYLYASCALILFWVPRIPTLFLLAGALALYTHYVYDFGECLAHQISRYQWWETQIYQGAWTEQYEYRKMSERYFLLEQPFEAGSFIVGMMCMGMAAVKARFLTGEWRLWTYPLIAVAALAAGTWLVYTGHGTEPGFGEEADARLFLWGSLLLSTGYVCVAILIARLAGNWLPVRALGSFGRMALTNYLLQSVICTTLFYGYGFGWYERTNRLEQLYVVAGVVAFEIVFSHVWLMVFRFGPMEWIWRTVSYWRFQPLLRKPKPATQPVHPSGPTDAGSDSQRASNRAAEDVPLPAERTESAHNEIR